MNKLYNRQTWHNNTTPALNETNLNILSKAVDDIDDRVIEIAGDVLVVVPEILEKYADIEALATNPPYIGQNGNWWTWDTDLNQYVDSGVDAGVSLTIGTTSTLTPGSDATVTNSGTATDPILNFGIPKGAKGDTGSTGATPNITATATVDANVGTPSVNVTKSGTAENPSLAFAFSNIKGAKGDTGATGSTGPTGATPNITATATVDAVTGTPSVNVTQSGTAENPSISFAFHNLKGAKGDTGATGQTGPAGQGVPTGGTTGQVLKKKSGTNYDTEWADESGGGSGGHTILNGSGSAMTQRTNLQFDGADVTDDSANDKTIVKTTPQSMIGDAWLVSHAYAVGDYCIDGNVLYKCKTAHTSSASNRPPYASYWDAVSVASEFGNIQTAQCSVPSNLQSKFTGTPFNCILKAGKIVTVKVYVQFSQLVNQSADESKGTFLTIPNGFRPSIKYDGVVTSPTPKAMTSGFVFNGTSWVTGQFYITSNGNVTGTTTFSDDISLQYANFTATYITD